MHVNQTALSYAHFFGLNWSLCLPLSAPKTLEHQCSQNKIFVCVCVCFVVVVLLSWKVSLLLHNGWIRLYERTCLHYIHKAEVMAYGLGWERQNVPQKKRNNPAIVLAEMLEWSCFRCTATADFERCLMRCGRIHPQEIKKHAQL